MEQTCSYFNKYYNNAKQGEHYHRQLTPYILKLAKVVNDYVVAKGIEHNALGVKLSVQAPESVSTASTMPSSVMLGEPPKTMEIGSSDFLPNNNNVETDQFEERAGKMEVEEMKTSKAMTSGGSSITIISSASPRIDTERIPCALPENFRGFDDKSSQTLYGYKKAVSTNIME